ncbi:unnamed protein product [Urochloa decumbens]|uniref:DUF1618 domain-containing protein n=1 Tax=Urochloa decumbens TaxID=240449 RepID=A0ABC9CB08_9POAL
MASKDLSSWVILDRFIHRSDRGVVDDADGTASEISYTCTGRPISASIRVADFPAVSRLHLHWPGRPEFPGLPEPRVVAAHDHSILFRALVPFEDPMCCQDTFCFPIDMFVYSAFSSPPSLHRLRPCFAGGVSTPDEDIYFNPYRRRQQRIMLESEIGLLCHGRQGGFTVVDFTELSQVGGQLCLLHHPALPPASASHKNADEGPDWMIKKVRFPEGRPSVHHWITDAILPLHGRFLCLVDNYQGILVVDVLSATDESSPAHLQLHFISLPDEALQSHRPHPDGDCPDSARCVSLAPNGMLKLVCITTRRTSRARPFTIASWILHDIKRSKRWHRGHIMEAAEFWGLYDGQSLPRVNPTYPLVNLANPDEISFLLKDYTTCWMIEINTWNKTLKSTAIYINEEEEACTTARARRNVFGGHSFIPSGFSNYLGTDVIKSRELSEMMQKAKVAAQKKSLEKLAESKEHVAEPKAAECRA